MSVKQHIPNVITSCNLLSGVVGLYFTFQGNFETALFCMLAAGLFDFLDGFVARLLHVSSPIGAQLDSLSDVVSFGVLPTAMLCGFSHTPFPLFLAAFSALRLAKFNVDDRQHSSFIGLPTTGAALFCAGLVTYCSVRPESVIASIFSPWWVVLILAAILSFLLVCEIPFFSFKGLGKKAEFPENIKPVCLVCLCVIAIVLTLVLGWHWSALLVGFTLAYILENLILAAFRI